MKLIKVAGEYHYVEDGPECEECINGKHRWNDGELHDHYGCHGTGLLPVEKWSDAQKAEWLRKETIGKIIEIGNAEPTPEYSGVWVFKINGEEIAEGAFLDTLLTAAVIAVAEVEP